MGLGCQPQQWRMLHQFMDVIKVNLLPSAVCIWVYPVLDSSAAVTLCVKQHFHTATQMPEFCCFAFVLRINVGSVCPGECHYKPKTRQVGYSFFFFV